MRLGRLGAVSLAVGVVDGLVFLGFEWLIKHGNDWVFNDVFHTDAVRWRIVPLALILSVALSAVLRLVRTPRWSEPHLDPLTEADAPDAAPPSTPALTAVAMILVVGAASLLAGASLGPEAPLVAMATALGAWAAARSSQGASSGPLTLASIGALLVAFFGSLIAIAVPLLILHQRARRLPISAVMAIVVAGLSTWGTLWLVQGNHHGFGRIPSLGTKPRDYLAAALLGALAVGLGVLLRWLVRRMAVVTQRIDLSAPWWMAAALFGLVLGCLYLIGGQTVQFSGSEGLGMLLRGEEHHGAWALAGLIVVKLMVTSWSLAAGYRGGLIFPAVFAGGALGLCAAATVPDLAGTGIMLGCIAGLLVEMTSPAPGVVMLLALLPAKLLALGLAGAAGAMLGRALIIRAQQTRVSALKSRPG